MTRSVNFCVQPVTGVPPIGSLLLGTLVARGARGTEAFSPIFLRLQMLLSMIETLITYMIVCKPLVQCSAILFL